MLVSDLISASMRLLGALAPGETPSSDEYADSVVAYNAVLENWNGEELMVPQIVNAPVTLQSGVQTYTIGTGGTFNTPRPYKIVSAGILDSSGLRHPMDIVPYAKWAAIREKTVTAQLPLELYYDNAWPTGNISVWPRPVLNSTLDLWVWQQLTAAVDQTTTLNLPPGYFRPLQYALALELAPLFERDPSETVLQLAAQSQTQITALNKSNEVAVLESELETPAPQPAQ